jgi:hypothetical protein
VISDYSQFPDIWKRDVSGSVRTKVIMVSMMKIQFDSVFAKYSTSVILAMLL